MFALIVAVTNLKIIPMNIILQPVVNIHQLVPISVDKVTCQSCTKVCHRNGKQSLKEWYIFKAGGTLERSGKI